MTFMLIAIISVIVLALFAVVFLSRRSQDFAVQHHQPAPGHLLGVPLVLPPQRQVVWRHEMARRGRPLISRQRSKPVKKKSKGISHLHGKLRRRVIFKRQRKQQVHRRKPTRRLVPKTPADD